MFALKHREAVEYDLLTRTGYELKDVGRALSWSGFNSFLEYIEPDSAIARELKSDAAEWAMTTKTNEILANIYDVLSIINAHLISLGSGKKPKPPKPYPRPDGKEKHEQMTTAQMLDKIRGKMRE